MKGMLKISEAASLGLHAMRFLAERINEGPLSTDAIALKLGVSSAHLSKVLQRLTKHGMVKAARGPGGGVSLAMNPEDVSMLQVYEAIDGPMSVGSCIMGREHCEHAACILGDLLNEVNETVRNKLGETKLK
jgi:Rrf2 family protein